MNSPAASPDALTAEFEWRIKKATAERVAELSKVARCSGDKLVADALDQLVLRLYTEASLALAAVPQCLRDKWDAERLERARA